MKKLRYTIKAIVEVDAEDPEEISSLLDTIREIGEATVEAVELFEDKSSAK